MIRPNLLVIAPYAPPNNAAEPIQVGRILTQLDRHATGRLVTIVPDTAGWAKSDASLALNLTHFDTYYLRLPLHDIARRILSSHRLSRLHNPDAHFWITHQASRVAASLKQKPDVIYSRAYPISAAILAQKLKAILNVPWVMHLSDPWADTPYGTPHPQAQQSEARAFADADAVGVTTQKQAQHYRNKYPAHAAKIFVSPNIMPNPEPTKPPTSERLNIVFAGNLYGERSPEPLIHALAMLQPAQRSNIQIDMYGNVDPRLRALVHTMPDTLHHHGQVSFEEAYRAQQRADVILSIEPIFTHPLSNAFMPSKVLEAIALGKPLLAITPDNSETESLCRDGYGWAMQTPQALAEKLSELSTNLAQLRAAEPKKPPTQFTAEHVAGELLKRIEQVRTS